jgi:hypothetical protein
VISLSFEFSNGAVDRSLVFANDLWWKIRQCVSQDQLTVNQCSNSIMLIKIDCKLAESRKTMSQSWHFQLKDPRCTCGCLCLTK